MGFWKYNNYREIQFLHKTWVQKKSCGSTALLGNKITSGATIIMLVLLSVQCCLM